jgi:hypothetical protein
MRRLILALCVLFALCGTLVPVFAQTTPAPSLMTFQGRLTKPDGTPVADGNYSIRFSLWNAASAGTEKWNQTLNPVAVRKGTFAALLNVASPANLFDGDLWLEIKIGTGAPLTPRQRLSSVAYALKANTVPDGSITGAKIANGTITADKLADGIGGGAPSGPAGGDLTGTYPTPELRTVASSLYKVSGTLMSALAGSANNPDQTQTQSSNLSLDSAWQSFTPSQTGNLTAIEVKIGTATGVNKTIPLILYAGEGTSGAEIARVTVTVTPALGFQFFTLASPLPVTGGQTYTWYIGRSSSLIFGYANANPYGGGRSDLGPTLDYAFRTYMTTSAASRVAVSADLTVSGGATIGGNTAIGGRVTVGGANTLEMGFGVGGKEANAGKIGYQTFSDGLDILGAGTAGNNRKIKLWAEGGLTFTGSQITLTGSQMGMYLGTRRVLETKYAETTDLGGFWGINALLGSPTNSIAAGAVSATVLGGSSSQPNRGNAHFSTVGGGAGNTAGGQNSTVAGGGVNTANGYGATIPGGVSNTAAGAYSFAAGRRAKANHDGTFVWADSQDSDFGSTGLNQFLVRAAGGVLMNVGPFNLNAGNTHVNANEFSMAVNKFTLHMANSLTNHALINGGLSVDAGGLFSYLDNPTHRAPMLRFGAGLTGEGIASKRTSGAGQFGLSFYTNYLPRMIVANNGNVGIGTDSPTYLLHVNGFAGAQAFFTISDARYKQNVATLENPLETILNLRGVTFDWNQNDHPGMRFPDRRQIGFIAQEVEKVLPELVSTAQNGYKSVAYQNVVPVLVEAVKTQQKQIEALQTRLKQHEDQQAQIEELKRRLDALQANR